MGVEALLGVQEGVDIGDTRDRGRVNLPRTKQWSHYPSGASVQRENTLSGRSLMIKSGAVPAEPNASWVANFTCCVRAYIHSIPAKYPDFFGIIPQFWMNYRDPKIPVDYPEIHCTRNKLDIVLGALQMTCHRRVVVLIDSGPP